MELRHLRYFVAVAEEGSFRQAAENRIFITQPALSRQVQKLEEELETQLFDRSGYRPALTQAGEAFLEEARRVLRQAEEAKETAWQVGRGAAGRLHISFVGSVAYNLLPPILRAQKERAPDVRLKLTSMTSAQQIEALRSGEIDVGFVQMPVSTEGLSLQTVLREPLAAALPAGHPLAGQGEIEIGALAKDDFILFPRRLGPGFFDQITGLCQGAGFSPHVAQEAVLMQTIVSLVASGLGVSIVPASVQQLRLEGVWYTSLEGAGAETEIKAAWRFGDENPALRRFLEVVKATGAES